ncbi:MAG: FG-GAP repeat domain-containing protein [Cyclobacteriaceae bacterium]
MNLFRNWAASLISFLSVFYIAFLTSCESEQKNEERLAKKYCSSCHLFPKPELLTKGIWKNGVFPEMAFRMGMRDSFEATKGISANDIATVLGTIPAGPMVSPKEWESIQRYFDRNAPDSLVANPKTEKSHLTLFEVTKVNPVLGSFPMITLLKVDTFRRKIFYGTRQGKLVQLNDSLKVEHSIQLKSPPSHLIFDAKNPTVVTLMGLMDPNDQAKGELIALDPSSNEQSVLIDSLKRPVNFERKDLNKDGREDFVVCAFGNYTGALLVYENTSDKTFQRHVLSDAPGARRVIVKDFNADGREDILALFAQGDEQIVLFINEGDFKFRRKMLLRFPPMYGSSYFDIADFNHDGKFDVITTQGDNLDYSKILKPYHGVRLFTQGEDQKFDETWFHPMHGASQAMARDFDNDGDIDIAAISYFPDFAQSPEEGFLYFENTGKDFKAHTTPQSTSGRWLVMEAADIDADGDCDILLGALDFYEGVPKKSVEEWAKDKASILVLKNTTRH